MTYLQRIAATVLVLAALAAQAADPAVHARDLAGLWKAKGRFGPDVHGPLIMQREGSAFVADILGRRLSVRTEAGELRFELPDHLGQFRGKLEGRNILGHWFQFGTAVNGSDRTTPVAVTPVFLTPDGGSRWRGTVAAHVDDFTFFLLLTPRPDGSLGAVLRNPEFDYGTQQGVERLLVDGNRVRLIGKRREKEQDVGTGTCDAENRVITLVFPGRGGSYDFRRDGDDSDFYPRGKNPGHYTYAPPPPLDDGWPVSTLDAENIDRAAIEHFIQKLIDMPMDSNDALQIHGLLMARHGKLVLEEYFHGEHRDKPHMTRSAAKSVTAVLAGAVMQAGAPLQLSSPVYQVMNGGTFPPDLEPHKRAMTLEHLLTMSSGFFCDDGNDAAPGNEETMWDQTAEPDFYRYTMSVPLATPPGENAVYCSASPNLALGLVGRVTKELPIYSFDRLIAGPMRIGQYIWLLDPAGNPYGGGGSMFLPRDFMKFGQLMLNGGTWKGRRILGKEFVAAASKPQYHLANIYYGYNWWMQDYPYRDRTVRALQALGAGGQILTVVPELDLVVASYAGNYSSRTQIEFGQNYVPRYILPAVRQAGEDRTEPVVDRDFKSPYGRASDGSRVTGR